ncbi:hypothetical protein BGW39_002273 [Mortierella sp. 14UC]|nr:hypothetical protein BGW39_002273 [Mortierella sp. 14UC]
MQQQPSRNHICRLYNHHQHMDHLAQQWDDSNVFLLDLFESFPEPGSLSSAPLMAHDEGADPLHLTRYQAPSFAWHPTSKTNAAVLKPYVVNLSTFSSDEATADSDPSSIKFFYRLFKALQWFSRLVIPCLQHDPPADHIQL